MAKVPCDIENLVEYDDEPSVCIYYEDGFGCIEIRGLENVVVLRFTSLSWADLFKDVEFVDEEMTTDEGRTRERAR